MRLLRDLPEENLLSFPMFWINSAVLFYFSGTLALSLMMDYLVHDLKSDLETFWTFRNFFRLAYCLALGYAAWLDLTRIRRAKTERL